MSDPKSLFLNNSFRNELHAHFLPYFKQRTDIAPNVRTYFWDTIQYMYHDLYEVQKKKQTQ